MSDGFTIDANMARVIYDHLIMEENGDRHVLADAIEYVLNMGFVFDMRREGGTSIIEHEWNNTLNNQVMREFIADMMKQGKLQYVDPRLDQGIKRRIRVDFGCDENRDITYIGCASNTVQKYLISDDFHHYDPKCPARNREAMKRDRTGALCRYLRRELGITVGRFEHCRCDFLGAED